MSINYHKPNAERESLNFYPTPPAWSAVLPRHFTPFPLNSIAEPCCGDGAMARVLKKAWDEEKPEWRCSDIKSYGYGRRMDAWKLKPVDVIVTNPPYNRDLANLTRHFLNTAGKAVCLLVRQTFLEGQDRFALFKEAQPTKIVIISNRMPDSQFGHCWVIWDKLSLESPSITWDLAK